MHGDPAPDPAVDRAPADAPDAPTRLARRLGTLDAVAVGLGAMLGAGVFSAFSPAAAAAGRGLLLGLALAAGVAWCNATSSAELAAAHPEAGGAYAYGRRRLGAVWGFLAGWAFVVGKLASCAAMAMTFAAHVAPSAARPVGVAVVVAATAVDALGVRATANATKAIVAVVLAALATVVGAVWAGGGADASRLRPLLGGDAGGVLEAAGFLFFAFAGYARIATLGEEVVDPRRTIPRAIPLALAIALLVYAAVAGSLLAVLGPEAIAAAPAPLVAAVEAAGSGAVAPLVRAGAAVACAGVLLSLLAGVSRTAFAMAAQGDLPTALAAVHPVRRVPARAQLVVGALVAAVVALADVRFAIGFSSFAVLLYYAVANASALRLAPHERLWPRAVAVAGIAGCLALAFALPWRSVAIGAAVCAGGVLLRAAVRALRRA